MFSKWDIIYISRFPESIKCSNCRCSKHFTISVSKCPKCGKENNISNIVAKIRPVILWIKQEKWYQSMSFGIPLSKSKIVDNKYNQPILLEHYNFLHRDEIYHSPMRAMIHQATRIDGNVLNGNKLIGKITDEIIKEKIENKMLSWLFE